MWLAAWKRRLPKPKLFFEDLFPLSSLSYAITKKPKRVNLRRKSYWGSWSSWGSPLIGLSFGFTVIRVLFKFLIDRILFRVLSDRIFIESSEIRYPKYAIIDSSLHQFNALFPPCCYFFIKSCYYFFYQKQIFCFAVMIILKNS